MTYQLPRNEFLKLRHDERTVKHWANINKPRIYDRIAEWQTNLPLNERKRLAALLTDEIVTEEVV